MNGAEAFAALGTENSKGTKVFALAGKIRHGGLVEVPMGITIRRDRLRHRRRHPRRPEIQGRADGRARPAAASRRDCRTPQIDYESINKTGAIMGSGGLVVMDDDDLHGGRGPVLPRLHPARVLRQVHLLPDRHQADAGDPRADHRRQGAATATSSCSRSWRPA